MFYVTFVYCLLNNFQGYGKLKVIVCNDQLYCVCIYQNTNPLNANLFNSKEAPVTIIPSRACVTIENNFTIVVFTSRNCNEY